jgi:hypothetical protein
VSPFARVALALSPLGVSPLGALLTSFRKGLTLKKRLVHTNTNNTCEQLIGLFT